MKNNDTVRFGISINNRLLKHFDDYISEKKYFNRSEAIRDLIRNALVEEKWREAKEDLVGTVTLVYDHHTRELADKLTDQQHTTPLSHHFMFTWMPTTVLRLLL
jgi:CopG family nickel-responsive transcriptional regulator